MTGILEREEIKKKKGQEQYLKYMAENFLKLMKDAKLQI